MNKPMRTKLIILMVAMIMISGCSAVRSKPDPKWRLTVEIDPSVSNRERLLNETIAVLQKRLDSVGVSRLTIELVGKPENGQIQINLPSTADPERERVKSFIVSPGSLQIVHVISEQSSAPDRNHNTASQPQASSNGADKLPQNQRLLPFLEDNIGRQSKFVVTEFPPIVDSADIRNAVAAPSGSHYFINFNLTPAAAEKFGAWTAANIKQSVAVVLNNEVKSISVIRNQMSDSGQIAGQFTKQSAEDLAQILNSGPLPAPLKIVKEEIN